MTHEEFIQALIRGFAQEPGARMPEYGGANEEDAVVRWMAYHVARYVLEQGALELDRERRLLGAIEVRRVWARWGRSGAENVDLILYGQRNGSLYAISLKAVVARLQNGYHLQIFDWRARRQSDVTGARRDEGRGRVRVVDPGHPSLFTMHRSPEHADNEETDEIPECCRRSLAEMQRILESAGVLAEILAAAPSVVTSSRTAPRSVGAVLWKMGRTGESYASLRRRTRQLTDAIVRDRVRTVIQLELTEHGPSSAMGQHWQRMLEAFE